MHFVVPCQAATPWHFLYFLPLPHGRGSLRPTFGSSRRTGRARASSPPTRGGTAGRVGNPVGPVDRGGGAPNGGNVSALGSFSVIGGTARRGGRAGGSFPTIVN